MFLHSRYSQFVFLKYCISLSCNVFKYVVRLIGPLTLGISLVIVSILMLLTLPPSSSKAAGPDTAYVVIQFDENDTIVRPVSFTAPISGLEALQITGLDVITTDPGFGPAVCSIESIGDSAANCFGSGFWAYSYWDGSQWQSYLVGAGSSVINDGAIELWAWSPSPGFMSPPSPGHGQQFVSAAKALSWLADQQSTADGGYGSVGNSIEVLMAIGANGYQSVDWRRQPDSPPLSSHVMANGSAYSVSGAAAAGKLAVGLSAAGGCYPYNAMQPSAYYITSTGIYSGGYGAGGAGSQSWGILGTQALSQSVPSKAGTYLKSIINSDGGWGWTLGNSDTNGTALAIQALVAAGEPVTVSTIVSGLNYLKSAQNNDGGFPYDPSSIFGTDSDTNSTAYVVQALLAAGQDPMTGTWVISNTNPISYLLGMQLGDGSFEWQSGSGPSQVATQQAIPALLGQPFPVRATDQIVVCTAQFLPVIFKN